MKVLKSSAVVLYCLSDGAQGFPALPALQLSDLLASTGSALDNAAKGASRMLSQAGKDVKATFEQADLGDGSRPPDGGAWGPENPLPDVLANPRAHLSVALADAGGAIDSALQGASAWADKANENMREDPGRTILHAAGDAAKVAVIVAPGMFWGPVFRALGFGVTGVAAGTAAARAQVGFGGFIPAKSAFSYFQSAATGGYGAAVMDQVVRATVVTVEIVSRLGKRALAGEKEKDEDKIEEDKI
ncbi:hypothetical protein GGS23DRAFT_289985 [Durotheca rogersii]|uniref:uncharacterized protein n=1 Tax=Durotheca rogersii TaxID=419775 RepID=UPI00221F3D9C|nr:uncharacterized protein GGS23DRAFT_289985 [Durotheca rogersii]KAI5866806.1 hypothetical protein GGS23DRAFT_289985 [Durotheca rogersii]